jgi:hypothetical protein
MTLVPATLPENGELQLGPVRLPEGRQVYGPGYSEGLTPVRAWVTREPVPDPGRVWSALSELSGQTGLVPFLATSMFRDTRRPWPPAGGFTTDLAWPADLAKADRLDGPAVLADRWVRRREGLGNEEDDELETEPTWITPEELAEDLREYRERQAALSAPFHEFPGPAPAIAEPVDHKELAVFFDSLPPARIGLAAAARSADLLAVLGWPTANWIGGQEPLTAVLRSWEDRFGARMFEVSRPVVRVLVARPPRDRSAALAIAAEQWALADECWPGSAEGLIDVQEIADELLHALTWGFYWS